MGLRLVIVFRKLQPTEWVRQKRTVTILKNSEFETMKVFEIRNDSGTRLNEMTRPDQNISRINMVSRIDPVSRINPRWETAALLDRKG